MSCRELDRYWGYVDVRDRGHCWPWIGPKWANGYGRFWLGSKGAGGCDTGAHRVAWRLSHGKMPPSDSVVMHSCDNPPCCNPEHLDLGTHLRNIGDMIARGRGRFSEPAYRHLRRAPKASVSGERNGHSKLLASQVRLIRWRISRGETQADIAREFGVSRSTVSGIYTRSTWKLE